MQLKHHWNDYQSNVITSAKRQMEREQFFIEHDIIVAVQKVLERKNIPFYETWNDITPDLASNDSDQNLLWFSVFLQTAAAVLTGETNLNRILKEIPALWTEILDDLPDVQEPDHLPVRLPDKNLLLAANAGDLSRIIMLYDMAMTPGQKMKNIYHALLNKNLYDCALQLNDRYGGLDKIDGKIMMHHFLLRGTSEEKIRFNRYFCTKVLKKVPEFWSIVNCYGMLDKVLQTALEYGVEPEGFAIKENKFEFPLRPYLYLFDELSKEISKYNPWGWRNLGKMRSLIKKFMDSNLNAARIFTAWEKKRNSDPAGKINDKIAESTEKTDEYFLEDGVLLLENETI